MASLKTGLYCRVSNMVEGIVLYRTLTSEAAEFIRCLYNARTQQLPCVDTKAPITGQSLVLLANGRFYWGAEETVQPAEADSITPFYKAHLKECFTALGKLCKLYVEQGLNKMVVAYDATLYRMQMQLLELAHLLPYSCSVKALNTAAVDLHYALESNLEGLNSSLGFRVKASYGDKTTLPAFHIGFSQAILQEPAFSVDYTDNSVTATSYRLTLPNNRTMQLSKNKSKNVSWGAQWTGIAGQRGTAPIDRRYPITGAVKNDDDFNYTTYTTCSIGYTGGKLTLFKDVIVECTLKATPHAWRRPLTDEGLKYELTRTPLAVANDLLRDKSI